MTRSSNNAKIAKFILGEAKFQDIAINNASRLLHNTGTFFVKACKDGSYAVVEAMLEQAQDLLISMQKMGLTEQDSSGPVMRNT